MRDAARVQGDLASSSPPSSRAQLADARSTTTAKLDAPVNKLARLLNSPSIKRVLLNDSLRVDFDRVIADGEVLVVKGALGAMGAGNTSVLMQLLVGMLDAALARQQDLVPVGDSVAVALKVDEAPLVLNRGFAETMALKRSAGLETVACWQTDSQWTDREVRDQLDALFAHRVYFATASARDARAPSALTMAEFSDTVRPGIGAPVERSVIPTCGCTCPSTTRSRAGSRARAAKLPFIARDDPAGTSIASASRCTPRASASAAGAIARDLRQPHWDRRAPQPRRSTAPDGGAGPVGSRPPERRCRRPRPFPARAIRELVELDGAHSVRWAKPIESHAGARARSAGPRDARR